MAGANNTHPVFVYGSLRRGGSYHSLLQGAPMLWQGRTEPAYELVDLGEYPGLIEGGRTAVYGELYAVSDAVLDALDAYEEVPTFYVRKPLCIAGQRAFVYVLAAGQEQGRPRIPSGIWPLDDSPTPRTV